jgi:hypothetical protein
LRGAGRGGKLAESLRPGRVVRGREAAKIPLTSFGAFRVLVLGLLFENSIVCHVC